MPKPAKKDADTPAFEEALAQLEELVEEMESDEVPLEDLIRKYEEGTRLYQLCEQRLNEARGRIEILRKKRNGETVLETFGDEPNGSEDEAGAPANDGELF
ncbi:MAG: exodeoxyribonuclease VII small subunit [Verrucomicrobiae bacterium]|nr:exodeoxyribonuclease VII small subunit [Verrucomicrobiae bacterium]